MAHDSVDKNNMIRSIEDFPSQCRTALELTKGISVQGDVKNIVVSGMGGSGIAGDLLKAYLRNSKIPVHVSKDYKLPEFVDSSTLVFAISYSGNTEETIISYEDAVRRKAKVVAISSGGRLAEICKRTIRVPPGYQPRAALGFLFFPMVGVLSNMNLAREESEEIIEAINIIENSEEYEKEAQAIAKSIKNRTVLLYSSNDFSSASYRWKCQINENSKMPAFCNSIPEMNHNEIAGYQSMDRTSFAAIFLRDNMEDEKTKKKMEITRKIVETKVDSITVFSKGNSFLARMLSLIHLGDFVSYYLAVDNKTDPTPVHVIESLKREIKE